MSARRRLPGLGLRALTAFAGPFAPPAGQSLVGLYHTVPSHAVTPIASSAPRLSLLFSLRAFSAAADLPSHTELTMPALSPTMSQGNIVSWKKKEGDEVQPGDIYCEVETDKATIEWESQEEGFLARIFAPDGTKDIEIGTPVAIIVEDADDIAAFKEYQPGSSSSAAAAAAKVEPSEPSASEAPPAPSSGSFPQHEVLTMPALSPTMSQGNIIAWKKKAGDEVQPGDILAEVETDKATIEWEAQEEGIIAKLLVSEGTSGVDVGAPVLVMVDDADNVSAFESFSAADVGGAGAGGPAPPTPPAAETPAPSNTAAAAPKKESKAVHAAPPPPTGGRIIASPYAKKLAAEASVSLAGVGGTGPRGRIVAADVRELIASGGAAPAAAGVAAAGEPSADTYAAFTDAETSQIRKVIARRLLESKQQIPHYYLTVTCRIDKLSQLRQQLNARLSASPEGGKLSVNDFIIKASALALRRVPEVNSSWQGDFIRQYHNVDCSVAVQTPAGLMVPIVRDADRKGLAEIAAEVKDLATRAKEGKLRPEEFTGGTFTVSNLGMFGVGQFAAIVNPPQSGILAVGAAQERVVPGSSGGFEVGNFVSVTASFDHRSVDGAVGAQWLKAFREYIEDPASMLL